MSLGDNFIPSPLKIHQLKTWLFLWDTLSCESTDTDRVCSHPRTPVMSFYSPKHLCFSSHGSCFYLTTLMQLWNETSPTAQMLSKLAASSFLIIIPVFYVYCPAGS